MNIEPNNFNRNFENCVKSYRVAENDYIRIWDSKNKIGKIIEILLYYKKEKILIHIIKYFCIFCN